MATFVAGYASRPTWTLQLVVTESALDAVANTSLVSWSLRLYRGSTQTPFNNAGSAWSVSGPGGASGTFPAYRFGTDGTGVNYSGIPVGGFVEIASGGASVAHDADGSKTVTFSASHAAAATLGTATIGASNFALTTLTRTPGVPSSVALAYSSDSALSLSWADTSASNGAPTTNQVETSVNGAAFAQVVSIAAATSVVLSSAANRKTVARVRATNAVGSSAYSASSSAAYTSPAAPSGVAAAKDTGLNIDVSWTPNVAFVEHQHVVEFSTNAGSSWSALATVAAGTSTYKHTSPNPALVHVYRVRAVNTSGGLTSAWVQSNSVQLLTAPNAPTLPVLAAFADKAAALVVPFTHNPVDTTAQTAYEMQFSTNGGSSWSGTGKVTSTVSSRTIAANTYAADVAVTIRVRTWGQATTGGAEGTGASAWSTLRTVTFKTRPTVTILSPVDASTWDEAELRVGLSFTQAEDGTFVSATLQLKQGSTVLETLQSTTLASTTFATEVEDGESYTVTATVTSSHGITSTLVDTDFSVAYTLPVAATVTVTYLPDSGIAQIDVGIPAAGGGEEDAVSVSIFRTIDGVAEAVQSQFAVEVGAYTFLDTTPTINGVNGYRVRTFSEDGAARDTLVDLPVTGQNWAFISNGPGYSRIVSFGGNLRFRDTPTAAFSLIEAAGRRSPIALFGEARGLEVTGSATIVAGQGSTVEEIEELVLAGGLVCYRDPSGRRVFGTLELSIDTEPRGRKFIEYTITEAT